MIQPVPAAFGDDRFIRISYAVSMDNKEGVDGLKIS